MDHHPSRILFLGIATIGGLVFLLVPLFLVLSALEQVHQIRSAPQTLLKDLPAKKELLEEVGRDSIRELAPVAARRLVQGLQ